MLGQSHKLNARADLATAVKVDGVGCTSADRIRRGGQLNAVFAIAQIEQLAAWFDDQLQKIPGKSDLAGAIRYARWRWDALTRYLDDGRLEISNNAAENQIRPLALGRKNWLFSGSDAGGQRAALFYTLIRTAILNGLEP